jgi:hypothetical protein
MLITGTLRWQIVAAARQSLDTLVFLPTGAFSHWNGFLLTLFSRASLSDILSHRPDRLSLLDFIASPEELVILRRLDPRRRKDLRRQ